MSVCVTGFGIKNHAYTVLQMSWDFFEAKFIVKQVRKDITLRTMFNLA